MKKIIMLINCLFWFSLFTWAQEETIPAASPPPVVVAPIYASAKVPNAPKGVKVNSTAEYRGYQNDLNDDPQRSKTFSKSFSFNRNDKLNISNVYGNITIRTWDKNEVKLDADIKAYANNDGETQKLIDGVTINATKEGNDVSFKTRIDDQNKSWGRGTRNGKKWRKEVNIDMVLHMPKDNALTAAQQYGTINLEDFSGPTSLKVQYGNLTVGKLSNANNYISVQYGQTTLKSVKDARIKVQYQYGAGLTIGDADNLEIEAQYTKISIGNIKNNANIKAQYGGGVSLGQVGSLNLKAQYATVNLNRLLGILTGKIQYGKLNIAKIEAGKIINIDADYSPVNLSFSPNFGADFNVNVSYGSFKYGNNITSKRLGDEKSHGTRQEYSGTIGKGGSSSVRINSRYDSVKFN